MSVSDLLVAEPGPDVHVEFAVVEDTTVFGRGTLQHRLLQPRGAGRR
jgi:hypothetical protein